MQLPANGLGKQPKMVQDPHMEDPDEVPDFWIQPCPFLAIAADYGLYQHEFSPPCIYVYDFNFLFQVNEIKILRKQRKYLT